MSVFDGPAARQYKVYKRKGRHMRNKLRDGERREFIRKKAYLDGMRDGRGRQLPVAEILEPPLVPGEDRGLDQNDGSIGVRGSIVELDGPAIGELEVGHPVGIDLQALIVPFPASGWQRPS